MSRLSVLVFSGCFLVTACSDPKDPQTWIKKLRDPEHATEAVRQLQELGDPAAIEPLGQLYQDFESHTILKAIISFKDNKATLPYLIKALEFTEDKYHNATLAAAALADLKASEAVEPLCKVIGRPMSIKSRANLAKVAAIEALAQIGDKQAVPCLLEALAKKPTDQDFHINKTAAVALGEIGDPRGVPLLIQALFMSSSIQGVSFPQARVALVKIGQPAVEPLLKAMQGKDENVNKMPKEWSWEDEDPQAVIFNKTAIVLGDLMAKEAVPELLSALKGAKIEGEDTRIAGVIEALGKISDERALEPLLAVLVNPKANYKLRMQVTNALTVMGMKKSLPALLEVAEKGNIEGGYTNLREAAAMAYGRIVGAEALQSYAKVEAMMRDPALKEYKATVELFKEVLDRMEVSRQCKDDAVCYGEVVLDKKQPLVKREKAGIMIGILDNGRDALPALIKALPEREPVLRLYYLESAKKLGKAGDAELIKTLEMLAEKDSKRKTKFLGADLATADKIALAVVKRQK